jgi:hypothetical protein
VDRDCSLQYTTSDVKKQWSPVYLKAKFDMSRHRITPPHCLHSRCTGDEAGGNCWMGGIMEMSSRHVKPISHFPHAHLVDL